MTTKTYSNADITVSWTPERCIHSEKCFHGLAKVFDPNRRPWIDMSAADTAAIKAQVDECPSGALGWTAKDAPVVPADSVQGVTIELLPDGPLLVKAAHAPLPLRRHDEAALRHHRLLPLRCLKPQTVLRRQSCQGRVQGVAWRCSATCLWQ